MNYKEYVFQFSVCGSEISEIVSALFHTILLHRTLPTLDFKGGAVSYNSYLGISHVDCKTVDLTYICVNSRQLIEKVSIPISQFAEVMRRDPISSKSNNEIRGSISLEFLVHRKGNWALGSEPSVWERWTVNICLKSVNENEKENHRNQLSIQLCDELCSILKYVNSPSAYSPSLGSSQIETEHIIDFSFPDICPYRFNINYTNTNNQPRSGVGVAMRRIFKDGRL